MMVEQHYSSDRIYYTNNFYQLPIKSDKSESSNTLLMQYRYYTEVFLIQY